jgi:hypothetical protein
MDEQLQLHLACVSLWIRDGLETIAQEYVELACSIYTFMRHNIS